MTTTNSVTIWCDSPGCFATLTPGCATDRKARNEAQNKGWTSEGRKDWCSWHKDPARRLHRDPNGVAT